MSFRNTSQDLCLTFIITFQSLCKLMEKILSIHSHYAKGRYALDQKMGTGLLWSEYSLLLSIH